MAIHTPDLNQDALNKLNAGVDKFPSHIEKKVSVETLAGVEKALAGLGVKKMRKEIDISKLPHYASLSPEIQKHFFNGNRVDYQLPNFKTGDIEHRGQEPKVEGNLQYLIGPEGVSSYLALSKEHQQFIQDLANLLLTDEYAKDIEKNKRNHSRKFKKVEGTKNLKTIRLAFVLQKSIVLLRNIEEVINGVDGEFKRLNKLLKRFEERNGYNVDSKVYQLLETLKLEVEAVEKVHEFLRKKGLEREMDNRKKSEEILTEIKKIEAKIKEKDDIIAGKKGILKEKDDIIAGKKGILKKKDEKIEELRRYLITLKRLSGLVGVYK